MYEFFSDLCTCTSFWSSFTLGVACCVDETNTLTTLHAATFECSSSIARKTLLRQFMHRRNDSLGEATTTDLLAYPVSGDEGVVQLAGADVHGG